MEDYGFYGGIADNDGPISSQIVLNYPIGLVDDAIVACSNKYPRYAPEPNGINRALHTYLIGINKVLDKCILRISLYSNEGESKTLFRIQSSAASGYVLTSEELQTTISEYESVILCILQNKPDSEIKEIISKSKSSSNVGCVVTMIIVFILFCIFMNT